MSNENDESIYRRKTAPKLADPAHKFYDSTTIIYKGENAHRDQWLIDGIPLYFDEVKVDERSADSSLRYTFGSLLTDVEARGGWQSLTESIRSRCGTAHILDLMGGAYCIPPDVLAGVDSLTGLRLEDISREYRDDIVQTAARWRDSSVINPDWETPKNYVRGLQLELDTFDRLQSAQNRACIYGDVWEKKTWEALDQNKYKRSIPSYDLVYCRPSGPFRNDFIFQTLPNQDEHILYEMGFIRLLSESVHRVNKNGGTILTQVPEIFSMSDIERWQRHLERDGRFTTTIRENKYGSMFRTNNTGYIMRLDFHKSRAGVDSDTQ